MVYHEAAENSASRITEIPEDMRRKIAACYFNLVYDTARKKEDDTQALLCIASRRVIQEANEILLSTDAQDS